MKVNNGVLKTVFSILSLSASIVVYGLELPANLENPRIIGEAYQLKGGDLLYREFHYFDEAKQSHWVLYKDANDKLLVGKSLQYAQLPSEPNVSQNNYLCGEVIEVMQQQKSDKVEIAYQADKGARLKEKSIERPEQLVIDAGFNQYLQDHWDVLVSDKDIEFEYLAPSQLKTFPFLAKAVSCDEELDGENIARQCFTIAPKKWWLKLALDPIVLTYDKNQRQLLSFKGMGNVADEKCDYMEVDIRYRYPQSL